MTSPDSWSAERRDLLRRQQWIEYEGRSAFEILTSKSTERRPLGRRRRRCEDNIRMGLKKIGTNTRNLIDSAQDRDYWTLLVNAELNFQVP